MSCLNCSEQPLYQKPPKLIYLCGMLCKAEARVCRGVLGALLFSIPLRSS